MKREMRDEIIRAIDLEIEELTKQIEEEEKLLTEEEREENSKVFMEKMMKLVQELD